MRDYYMPETPITDAVVVTNADRIRAMTDEELAEFICGIFDDDEYFGKFINGRIIPCYDQHKIAEWLKQPAEEEAQPDCTYNKNGHCIGQKLMPECDAKNCDRRK